MKNITLDALLSICEKAELDVKLEDDYIVWNMDEDTEASIALNEDGTNVNFCYISGADVNMDDPNDLMLINAINAALVDDEDLPACSVCMDVYDEETEEVAIMLRASQSLKGGVSEDRLVEFFGECAMAIGAVEAIIYGGEDDIEDDDAE